MPLYDYACTSCGHSFTIRQGFHDEPQALCPKCGGQGSRRLSIPSVVYKGSGFYSTDYGRRSGGTPSASEGSGEAAPTSNGASGETHPHPHPQTDLAASHDH